MAAKNGDKVKIEYEGKLDDGSVFDSSESHGEPLEFEMGASQVIKGFENAVEGMEEGDEKDFKVEPSEAYGDHNPKLIKEVPKDMFPKDQEPKEGLVMVVGLPNGEEIPATIVGVADETISLDLNHPLAGKRLNFKIKLIGIST
jgi:FKBP-type peptidyl-prolyl cis-trans isomerase 2